MQWILILMAVFNPLPLGGEGGRRPGEGAAPRGDLLLWMSQSQKTMRNREPRSENWKWAHGFRSSPISDLGSSLSSVLNHGSRRQPATDRPLTPNPSPPRGEGGIPAGHIDTIAGNGTKGYAGDGDTGIKASLNQPFHVDVDNKGMLYIAEADNHCIRKLDLKTRILTTVAGTGKKGYGGDGGPAAKATFNEPYAVLVDPNDNLYVVDRLNADVRKIDAKTGIITTVAGNGTTGFSGDGGPGNKAQLREPNDCCFDGRGGLLIADVGDWRVRRLDLETGVITTFAGIGRPNAKGKPARNEIGDGGPATKAILVGARAVASDGKGTVYICEREGSSIRKVDPSGVITTIAGTGAWGNKGDGGDAAKAEFKGPKGIRLDRAGNLFIVDTENHSIRRIDAKTNVVTTIAGGRKGPGGDGGPAIEAGMARPHGCVVDADGYLYVADSENHRVRRIKLP